MGLLDFFKKALGASSDETRDTTLEQAVTFKGDLALIRDGVTTSDNSNNVAGWHYCENKNSEDSIIYMSFLPAEKGIWVCSECGTHNEEGLNGCIVCGFKK